MGTKSNWYELSVKDPNIVNEDALLAKMRLLRQLGGVSNFNIDASILEFSQTTQKQLGIDHLKIKEKRLVNLFLTGVNAKSLAFGKIEVTAIWNDQFKIEDNMFDWNIERDQYGNPFHTNRNVETVIGWWTTHFLPASWFFRRRF